MNSEIFEKAKLYFLEGSKLYQENNYDLAEKQFIKSLELVPERLSTILNLISIFIKTDQKIKLQEILDKYKNLNNEKEILYGLAFNYYFCESFSESIKICNKIIHFQEFRDSIQDLLASNYKKQKLFLDALKIYKQKLKENRNHLVFYNIGCLFLDLGRTRTAHYYFNKSKEIKNDDYTNLNNLSLCKLKLKEFKEGFLLFENRLKKKTNAQEKKFNNIKSPNSPSEIKDKKILIWDEQGLGDTIQFSRFVIDLLKYTKNITFVVNSKLAQILSNLNKDIFVTSYENLKTEKFDFQIPVCSLPKFLNIEKTEDINYYKLNINYNDQDIISIDNNKLNVGLAWSGNKKYFLDSYRSIPFKYFKNLLNIKDINFYKLSTDAREAENDQLNLYPNLFDLGHKSFFEISHFLKNLDLVISADTSFIHLAGILNINSILLLHYSYDWRWFDNSKSTVWYPSVKIIKQNKFDEWDNVFSQLLEKIKKLNFEK